MFLYQGPSSSYKNHGKSEQSQGHWRWPTGELRSHGSWGQCVGGAEVPQGEATAVWCHIHCGGAEIPGTPCGLGIMQWLLQVSQLAWFFLHSWQRKIAPLIRYIFNIPGTLSCIESGFIVKSLQLRGMGALVISRHY